MALPEIHKEPVVNPNDEVGRLSNLIVVSAEDEFIIKEPDI